jgi:lysophospholipase
MGDLTETDGFLPAKDNLRLYTREIRPASAKAEVAVLHGYGDHSGRYLEVMRHLAKSGYAVHAVDYRGHGQADGRRGHVDRFSEYLDDLDVFFGKVKEKAQGRKLFVLAHSHGGLLMLNYGIARTDTGIAATVISDPYLQLKLSPPKFLVMISGLLSKILPWLSVGNPLKTEMLTHDEGIQKATAADPLYNHNATPRWFTESNRAQIEVKLRAPEFKLPSLWLIGADDPIADPQVARETYDRLGSKDKDLIEYPGFRHEVLNETGRERVFADLTRWLDARV